MTTAQDLLQQMRAAFSPEPFFGSVTGGCTCEECTELARSLSHQSWSAIADDTMEAHFGSLPLLSNEAFSAFLPAWLTRSLFDLDTAQQKFREWTLYSLALYYDAEEDDPSDLAAKTDELRRLYETLTPEQLLVVQKWLRLMREHARISDWDRESIDRALHLTTQMCVRGQSERQQPADTPGSSA